MIPNNIEYEIKIINNNKHIYFTKKQIKNFNNEVNVMIFKPFSKIPYIECKMSDIINCLKRNTKKNIKGVNIIIKK
jgi:hypothetical protein